MVDFCAVGAEGVFPVEPGVAVFAVCDVAVTVSDDADGAFPLGGSGAGGGHSGRPLPVVLVPRGQVRTDTGPGLSRLPLPVGLLGLGAEPEIRTQTVRFLRPFPLPVGVVQLGPCRGLVVAFWA